MSTSKFLPTTFFHSTLSFFTISNEEVGPRSFRALLNDADYHIPTKGTSKNTEKLERIVQSSWLERSLIFFSCFCSYCYCNPLFHSYRYPASSEIMVGTFTHILLLFLFVLLLQPTLPFTISWQYSAWQMTNFFTWMLHLTWLAYLWDQTIFLLSHPLDKVNESNFGKEVSVPDGLVCLPRRSHGPTRSKFSSTNAP